MRDGAVDVGRRRIVAGGLAGAASLALPSGARGQLGAKPVRIVVPLATGGSADVMCRVLATGLAPELGQPVIVDNRPGAGGLVGMAEVARAAPDGLTLGYSLAGALTVAHHVARRMPYDPAKDLAPVSQVIAVPEVIVVHPKVPARTLEAFVAYVKANPGKLSYASAGNATIPHLGGELLKKEAGIDLLHVPYKGSGPALNDLLGGQTEVMVADITLVRHHILGGRLAALAIAGPRRVPHLPAVPTSAEAGLPGMQVSNWHALVAPGATPLAVRERLHEAVRRAVRDPAVARRMEDEGAEIVASTPAALGTFLAAESAKWGALVKTLDLRWD
jgi:tripartite-type tricarboxylate transporter receptor subunit TctC